MSEMVPAQSEGNDLEVRVIPIITTEQYYRDRAKSIGRGDGGIPSMIANGHASCHTCRVWYPTLTGFTTYKPDGTATFCCSHLCAERRNVPGAVK